MVRDMVNYRLFTIYGSRDLIESEFWLNFENICPGKREHS